MSPPLPPSLSPEDKDLLAAGFAAGALDPEEHRQVEEALASGDAELRDAVARYRDVVEGLAAEIAPVEPSPALRSRLLERAEEEARDAHAVRRAGAGRSRWRFAAAAALLLALLSGFAALRLAGQRDAARASLAESRAREEVLATRLAESEEQAAALDERLAESRALVSALTAPRGRSVQLTGAGPASEAHARAYVDPSTRRVVVFVYDLPPLPSDRTYQLWVIVEGEAPVDAGTFGTDAGGRGRHEAVTIPEVSGPATIAVTIEPAQGVPQPTGPIVLAGS